MEHKNLSLSQCEVKFGAEGALQFSGYASKFNGVDSYGDTIQEGAYKNTLADRDRPIALRWNHYGPVIGKFTNIYEDNLGLYVEGELTKGHSVAEDAAALLRHGAIDGMSIGYIAKDYGDNMPHAGKLLKEIDLIEISIVEEPADNMARIDSLKSATKLKDVEQFLRSKGLSQNEATVTVAQVKKLHGERESEKKESEVLSLLNNFKV